MTSTQELQQTQRTSTADLANHLGVHPATVRRLAGAGRISGLRVGRQWRFSIAEVEAQLRNAPLSGDELKATA